MGTIRTLLLQVLVVSFVAATAGTKSQLNTEQDKPSTESSEEYNHYRVRRSLSPGNTGLSTFPPIKPKAALPGTNALPYRAPVAVKGPVSVETTKLSVTLPKTPPKGLTTEKSLSVVNRMNIPIQPAQPAKMPLPISALELVPKHEQHVSESNDQPSRSSSPGKGKKKGHAKNGKHNGRGNGKQRDDAKDSSSEESAKR